MTISQGAVTLTLEKDLDIRGAVRSLYWEEDPDPPKEK